MTRLPVYSRATGEILGYVDDGEDIGALAACILSGQVPDERVPSLVAETPGLREELERRSAAMSSALPVEAGRGASISSPDGFRPADLFDLHREGALTHRLREQERCCPVKRRSLLSKFISSLHPASFLNRIWRK